MNACHAVWLPKRPRLSEALIYIYKLVALDTSTNSRISKCNLYLCLLGVSHRSHSKCCLGLPSFPQLLTSLSFFTFCQDLKTTLVKFYNLSEKCENLCSSATPRQCLPSPSQAAPSVSHFRSTSRLPPKDVFKQKTQDSCKEGVTLQISRCLFESVCPDPANQGSAGICKRQ